MKGRSTTISLLAAAAAACVLGSVAAAPTSKPPAKPVPSGPKPPAVSKFRQHQLDMMKVSAPGDEYFGRLKLSYLGINNTFRDESIRAGAYTTDSHIISQVDFAEDALRGWANHYPKDPQLARSYFMAYTMYRKIWTEPGQTKAWQYLHIIEQRFPSSYFGKLVKKDLIGFTEHYFMEPQPCPSVEPSQSPLPGGRRPPPTPSPTPSPVPTEPGAGTAGRRSSTGSVLHADSADAVANAGADDRTERTAHRIAERSAGFAWFARARAAAGGIAHADPAAIRTSVAHAVTITDAHAVSETQSVDLENG